MGYASEVLQNESGRSRVRQSWVMMFPRAKTLPGRGVKGTDMTQKKHSAKKLDWKEIFESDTDGLRALVQQVVQEVLEAEMDETIGARKGERTESRVSYRSGYYARTLVTRVGKLV